MHLSHEDQHDAMKALIEAGCPAGIMPFFMGLVESIFKSFVNKADREGENIHNAWQFAAQAMSRTAAMRMLEADLASTIDADGNDVPDDDLEAHEAAKVNTMMVQMFTGISVLLGLWTAAKDVNFGPFSVRAEELSFSQFLRWLASTVDDEAANDERAAYAKASALAHTLIVEEEPVLIDDPESIEALFEGLSRHLDQPGNDPLSN